MSKDENKKARDQMINVATKAGEDALLELPIEEVEELKDVPTSFIIKILCCGCNLGAKKIGDKLAAKKESNKCEDTAICMNTMESKKEKKEKRDKKIDDALGKAEDKGGDAVANAVGDDIGGIPTDILWKIFCCCCKAGTKVAADKVVHEMDKREEEKKEKKNINSDNE